MSNIIDHERNLRVNVRDPRGPHRIIVAVVEKPNTTELALFPCGHVGNFNQIFHYEIGESIPCFACRFSPDNVISEEAIR